MIIAGISGFNYSPKGINNVVFKSKNEPFTIKDVSDEKVGKKKILTFSDPKYKDLSILITPDTVCKGMNNEVISFDIAPSAPSFCGQVHGSIANNEKGKYMARAYEEFFTKGMSGAVEKSPAASKIKDDYNFYVPSDGDGTRYKDITTLQGGMTKPASFIPAKLNDEPMRLIHVVLTNFSKTGKLENKPQFVEVEPAKGSAFALLEGLKSGEIPTDKPLVFSWGDNFTDLSITDLILEHEKNRGEKGNSGLTLLAITASEERVRSLSVVKFNNFKDRVITNFVEKPKGDIKDYQREEFGGEIPSSVGPFIISTQVLEWLKENYTSNPEKFFDPKKGKNGEYDFSSRILEPLVEEFGKGTFRDEQGREMKMRAKILSENETWSDLGAQTDFSLEMYRIKAGTAYRNMQSEIKESIEKNIDDNKNITFNEKARDLFAQAQKEYGLTFENAIVWAA